MYSSELASAKSSLSPVKLMLIRPLLFNKVCFKRNIISLGVSIKVKKIHSFDLQAKMLPTIFIRVIEVYILVEKEVRQYSPDKHLGQIV
jgi:hypothetical protein